MVVCRLTRKVRSMRIKNLTSMCTLFGIVAIITACATGRSERESPSAQRNGSPSPREVIAGQPSANQLIRSVDFANFTYPWVADLRGSRESFSIRRGQLSETRDESGMVDEMGVLLASISYGDVTGDEIEEAMVVLSIVTGGSSIPHIVYIYTLQDNRPKLLWAFSTGDRGDGGLRRVYAESGKLVVELYGRGRLVGRESNNMEDQLGACCPDFFTRARYEWQGNSFSQRGGEEILSNPEGHGSPVMTPYDRSS